MPNAALSPSKHGYGQPRLLLTDDMAELAEFKSDEMKDTWARKCKIVCTMGPKCWEEPMLLKLLDAGMNVARLNFSHGDHETHGATVARIRAAVKQRPDKYCAIMLDTKGPEIRTGEYAYVIRLQAASASERAGVTLLLDSSICTIVSFAFIINVVSIRLRSDSMCQY